MIGSALRMRSPSRTIRSRSTPWVAGCWGPMLSVMSAVARPPAPSPTVTSRPPVTADRSVVEVMAASLPHAPSSEPLPTLTCMTAVDAAELLDLSDPAVVADPYPAFAALRAEAPVAWHSGLGLWVATSHAACSQVLRERSLGRIFRPRAPEDEWDTY